MAETLRGAVRQASGARACGMELVPFWDLELLGAATVLVVGRGALQDEIVRGLSRLGLGTVVVAEASHPLLSEPLPGQVDLIVHCGGDPCSRGGVRATCRRLAIPWIDVRLDVFHGLIATTLPGREATKEADGAAERLASQRESEIPANPAMAAIMGGLAAQEAAKVLLRAKGFPTLAGRICLVDGQSYRMSVIEPAIPIVA
ncbi:MAG: hypothetical protein FJZ01_09675 [Candidatus Sericytochromatia bacterium]|nr:hypothetical protein [Candidatus Tanganyikabacteria bacterium]